MIPDGGNLFQRNNGIDQIGAKQDHAIVIYHIAVDLVRNLKVDIVEQPITADK